MHYQRKVEEFDVENKNGEFERFEWTELRGSRGKEYSKGTTLVKGVRMWITWVLYEYFKNKEVVERGFGKGPKILT